MAQAGVRPLSLHSTRHYAATSLLRSGVPVTAVAAVLGHSSPVITLTTYAHAVPSDTALLRAAMVALEAGTG